MKRLGGHPLLILLGLAGILVTGYSLTLLPFAVTLLVVGLLCIGGAITWLYRPRGSGQGFAITGEAGGRVEAEGLWPGAAAESRPASGESVEVIPQQWQMVQPWVDMVAREQPVAEPWTPPEAREEWRRDRQEEWAPYEWAGGAPAEPWSAEQPEAAAGAEQFAAPGPDPAADPPVPAVLTEVAKTEQPGKPQPVHAVEGARPAPRPPAPPRRPPTLFAHATTYQDGEVTKRTQVALKLSGRVHRPQG